MKKRNLYKIWIHIFFILLSLCFLIPMIMIVSVSFSSEASLLKSGYSLLPRDFTLDAYRTAFGNGTRILRAYGVTIASTAIGTILTLVSAGMTAYALSRPNFAYKNFVSFVVFFTMVFSGGTIPTYIIYSKYYHLGNTFWVYILPALTGGAWNILMMRSFFQGLPEGLFDAAKIDGASELQIFVKVAVPLSKPVIATVAFMTLVGRWNDWQTSYIYIRDQELYTVQYLLQQILQAAEMIKELAKAGVAITLETAEMPSETLKYAMCVIAAGPMLLVFPFFQKYFAKGTTIGAVKG